MTGSPWGHREDITEGEEGKGNGGIGMSTGKPCV